MNKMKSKDGHPLYKKIKAKIFSPGNRKHVVRENRAPAGQGFHDDGISEWLKSVADAIELQWPNHEYRMVTLGPASFNFVWVREISAPEVAAPIEEAVSA